MKTIIIVILLLINWQLSAQEKEVSENISAVVFLDSFVVTATKKGFDITDFIDIVQKDESFFQAFHNLRFQEYQSSNQIEAFNSKGKIKATYNNRIQQNMEGNCRTMTILEENASGNFFKRKKQKKHRYYTARMHDQVFHTHGKVCGNPNETAVTKDNLSGIQKNINELKKLIFQPGRAVDIPFIGGKAAIFEEDMLQYYDFFISSKSYLNQWDCYVFKAVAKPKYRSGKTIIKYLETYFDKDNFQVVARNYHLKYDGLFDFDVKMKVELDKLENKYLPTLIEYDGDWKIPTKKREEVVFKVGFVY